jgi:hypothetical protein
MPQTPHVEKHFTASETVRDIVIDNHHHGGAGRGRSRFTFLFLLHDSDLVGVIDLDPANPVPYWIGLLNRCIMTVRKPFRQWERHGPVLFPPCLCLHLDAIRSTPRPTRILTSPIPKVANQSWGQPTAPQANNAVAPVA